MLSFKLLCSKNIYTQFAILPPLLKYYFYIWLTDIQHKLPQHKPLQSKVKQENQDHTDGGRCYLSERTSDTLLTMPFSSRVGNSIATVLWAAEPVDSHIRVHTWTERERERYRHLDVHTPTITMIYTQASTVTNGFTLLSVFSVRSAAFLTDS